jgi:hypothetical protein
MAFGLVAGLNGTVIPAADGHRAPAMPDFRHLPEPIRLAETTTAQPASEPPSPDFGRDPDHEWMLRFGAS